jgi:hypothetical protein
LQGASSSKLRGIFGDLPDSFFHTPIAISYVSHLPITGTFIKSELEDFLIEYKTFSPNLKK